MRIYVVFRKVGCMRGIDASPAWILQHDPTGREVCRSKIYVQAGAVQIGVVELCGMWCSRRGESGSAIA